MFYRQKKINIRSQKYNIKRKHIANNIITIQKQEIYKKEPTYDIIF